MKKLFLIIPFTSMLISINDYQSPSIKYTSKSFILIDGYSGEIIEGKNYYTTYSVASISKIMTAIIAIESEKLFYSYTIDERMVNIEGSSLYLQIGDNYRLIDLVYGLLLRSGNDAAYAIANIVSDDVTSFVTLMNNKANELNLISTHYSNPCGLDVNDEGNNSSSYDMAMLMKYCMDNELFREIISTKRHYFGDRYYTNKNKLIHSYEYLLGGKTGYTTKAKRTLVTASKKDEQYLIMVTLNCASDYQFHKDMYEYYFNNYKYIVFLRKGINYIDIYRFDSDRVIGLRIKKKLTIKGIKKYFINPLFKSLHIYFIDQNGNEYTDNVSYYVEITKNY